MGEPFLYSLVNLPTPKPEKRSSRFSNRSSSFQRTQESFTPSSVLMDRTLHSAEKNYGVLKFDTFLDNTPIRNNVYSDSAVGHTLEVTALTSSALASEHPALAATAGMYADFMEAYRSCQTENTVFSLLDDYEQLCEKYLRRLKKVADHASSKADHTIACMKLLTEERDTWQLTKILLRDRLEAEPGVEGMYVDTIGRQTSDREVVNSLFSRDSVVRRAQMVVDWLESCAATDQDAATDVQRIEYFSDGGCAWENTLHMLQAYRVAPSAVEGRVTELDPDAPFRQGLALHSEDSEDETRLLQCVFTHVRRGQLQKAQQLAIEQGHHWLAAALEGWRPYHDPNYEGFLNGSCSLQLTEGNAYRDLWKSECWAVAASSGAGTYERAIYAVLCGNLQELLPVCLGWKDHLWARLRVFVDVSIEQELRVATQQVRGMEPLPHGYPTGRGSLEQVFRNLSATPSEQVQKEGESYYHIVQRCIILDDISGLLQEMQDWSSQALPKHLVRFIAHMVLLLRNAGYVLDDAACNAVLRTYVRDLIDGKQVPLVATYAAALPPREQVGHYARLLLEIKAQDAVYREQCLGWARDAGLDVPAITRTLVEHVRTADEEPAPTTAPSLEVLPKDREKITSLDWLLFDEEMRGEAIRQANALMREFVLRGKLGAAVEAFEMLPADSVEVAAARRQNVDSGAEEDAREYFCFHAYLQAHRTFKNWFDRFHHQKPQPLSEAPTGAKFSERVAYEHKVRSHSAEMDLWKKAVAAQANEVSKSIYNVLLFVDGGWMVDRRGGDEVRREQLVALRKLCIPALTFLLHEALHKSGMLRECLEIADVIVSERHKLYAEFSRQELHTLLSMIRESSIMLLQSGYDALGSASE